MGLTQIRKEKAFEGILDLAEEIEEEEIPEVAKQPEMPENVNEEDNKIDIKVKHLPFYLARGIESCQQSFGKSS